MKKIAVIALLIAAVSHAVSAEETQKSQWQSVESITAAAKVHAENNGLRVGVRQKIEAGPVDQRLLMTACSQPLATAFAPGVKSAARMTVEVKCPVPGGWKVFVPVTVQAFDQAVVITRAMERGQVLAAGDVALLENQVSDLPGGYLRDVSVAVGKRLERSIAAGTVLSPSVLHIEQMVRRGDHVTLVAQAKGVSIKARGVAMSAGGLDDRIRIKNLSSGKEVDGVVRDTALVEVTLR